MKSIALIHTVKTVANSFDQTLKDYVGEPVKVHNLWDDFLANNPNEIGEFTIENRCRLYNDIKSAEMTGADMIVVTCSTLTPVVNMIRPFIKVPLIAIDDAMGRKAVTYGDRILVLATAGSTEVPMREKLNAEAEKQKRIKEAEGQAEAIRTVQKATAEGIEFIKQAGADDAVLTLKSLEAFAKAADGRATKIIIPSELQGIAGLTKTIAEVARPDKAAE